MKLKRASLEVQNLEGLGILSPLISSDFVCPKLAINKPILYMPITRFTDLDQVVVTISSSKPLLT